MKIGQIHNGKVVSIWKTHIVVNFEDEYTGILHISSISDYYVSNISSMFKKGNEYYFKTISVNNEKKSVKLDWKSIHPRFLKNPFKYEIKETESGFKKLKENTEKEIEND